MALAVRLQRSISKPLLDLAAVAQAVAADGDHGGRNVLSQRDEVGELAARFNAMLAELQDREQDLQQHRGRLEDEVEQRTALCAAPRNRPMQHPCSVAFQRVAAVPSVHSDQAA